MLNVAVLGAPGYSGEELIRILIDHPHAKITYVSGKEERSEKIQDLFPYLRGKLDLPCPPLNIEEAARAADCIFLCLPHTASMGVVPAFLAKGKTVIDVSADYRLKDPAVYEKYYGVKHQDAARLKEAVYGLPEMNRSQIKGAKLIANPGCYPTGAALAVLPLLKNKLEWNGSLVIDAKSGMTGAGRKAVASMVFAEVNENFKAYKVLSHQHEAEIAQTLAAGGSKNARFVFVPHLLPIDRGILSTVYVQFTAPVTVRKLREAFEGTYASEPFVKVLPAGRFPEVKHVNKTNQCHIGLAIREETSTAVIITAIDNLGKGAAGQAVQNMNLALGFGEKEGLT